MNQRSKNYLAAADVLRVVSISLVGWYHIWQQSWLNPSFDIGRIHVNMFQFVRNGYMLVDVMLILSGFLVALPYARARLTGARRPTAKEFYWKRFLRIYPSYLFSVVAVLFLWALPQDLYFSPGAALKDVFTHLTFTHNLFPDTYLGTPLLIVLWTMAVEVQFYVIFPLIAKVYEREPGFTCFFLTAAAVCSRLYVSRLPDTNIWVNQLPCMLDLYACGMAAAWFYTKLSLRELSEKTRWALAVCAVLALGVIFQIVYKQDPGDGGNYLRLGQLFWRFPLGLAGGVFLVCGCLQPPGVSRVFGNPVTRFFSSISYNFYIWHQFLAVVLKKIHFPAYTAKMPNVEAEQPWQTRFTFVCFLAAILAGTLVTYLLEKPVIRLASKTPAPPDPAPPEAE